MSKHNTRLTKPKGVLSEGQYSINMNEPRGFNKYKGQLLCIEMNHLKREFSARDQK